MSLRLGGVSHCFFFQSCEPVNGSSLPVNGPSCEPVNGSLRSTDYCVQRTLGLTCPLPCCLGKATSPIELKRMLLPIRRRRAIGAPPFLSAHTRLPLTRRLPPGPKRTARLQRKESFVAGQTDFSHDAEGRRGRRWSYAQHTQSELVQSQQNARPLPVTNAVGKEVIIAFNSQPTTMSLGAMTLDDSLFGFLLGPTLHATTRYPRVPLPSIFWRVLLRASSPDAHALFLSTAFS